MRLPGGLTALKKQWERGLAAAQQRLPQHEAWQGRWRIECVLLGKEAMHELNWNYRESDEPTDVLSFRIQDENVWGQLFICPEKVAIYAKEEGWERDAQMNKTFVHGVLHLLGYDHENDADMKEMFQLQEEIYRSAYGDV